MNINLNLKIGEGEKQKEFNLTYDEAKELYNKLGELFNKPDTVDWPDWYVKIGGDNWPVKIKRGYWPDNTIVCYF